MLMLAQSMKVLVELVPVHPTVYIPMEPSKHSSNKLVFRYHHLRWVEVFTSGFQQLQTVVVADTTFLKLHADCSIESQLSLKVKLFPLQRSLEIPCFFVLTIHNQQQISNHQLLLLA